MQDSKNDNYTDSDNQLFILQINSILNIRTLNLISIKKHQQLNAPCAICRRCFVSVSIWREGHNIKWAGHVERMADDRLPQRVAELREPGRRRRGRPRLRWEDCVKRDVKKAGEEEDWKKKTRDRGGWKRLSDEVVKKLRPAPHP